MQAFPGLCRGGFTPPSWVSPAFLNTHMLTPVIPRSRHLRVRDLLFPSNLLSELCALRVLCVKPFLSSQTCHPAPGQKASGIRFVQPVPQSSRRAFPNRISLRNEPRMPWPALFLQCLRRDRSGKLSESDSPRACHRTELAGLFPRNIRLARVTAPGVAEDSRCRRILRGRGSHPLHAAIRLGPHISRSKAPLPRRPPKLDPQSPRPSARSPANPRLISICAHVLDRATLFPGAVATGRRCPKNKAEGYSHEKSWCSHRFDFARLSRLRRGPNQRTEAPRHVWPGLQGDHGYPRWDSQGSPQQGGMRDCDSLRPEVCNRRGG